jgi:hypothetical protein
MHRAALFLAAVLITGLAAAAASVADPSVQQLIAFEKGGDKGPSTIWVAGTNGSTQRKLGTGELPMLSPDGRTVAALNYANPAKVILYSSSGGSSRVVRFRNFVYLLGWSPDSRYLAVSFQGNGDSGTGGGLAVIDATTGKYRTVANGTIDGASFSPSSDRLVYGLASSVKTGVPVNLHEVNANGSGRRQITTNGNSLNPLWGAKGIAFDRETQRGVSSAPAYQVWLLSGGHMTQLTHMKIPQLVDGVVPLAFSSNGNRMIATFVGQDTNYAYALQISPFSAAQVKIGIDYVVPHGISADGSTLLVDVGEFMNPPSDGAVETLPFGGGPASTLLRGGDPSWNG